MSNTQKLTLGRYDYASFSCFFAYASSSVVIPVALLSLSKELGFDLESGGFSAGGALEVGRSIPIIATMVLSGFIAGKYGKRKTFGISLFIMGLGMMLCAFAPTYGVIFAALAISGIGEGIVEGIATPFVNDLHKKEAGRYVNFSHSFWPIGVLFTVLISGFLLTLGVSWRYLIFGSGFLAFIPTLLLLLPEKKGHEYPEHPEIQDWRIVCSHALSIMKKRRFWLFFLAMFVAGGGEFCLTFWCASYIQLNFSSTAWAGGAGTGLFAGGMIISRTLGGYYIRQEKLRSIILIAAAIGVVLTLFIPVINSLWLFFVLLFFAGLAVAPYWPTLQTYAVDRMHEEDSTMMYILLSCAGIPGCSFFTWLLGFISTANGSLTQAFYIIPACFSAIIFFVGYDYLHNERKQLQ